MFVPDIGMFIASLTIWLVCRNMVQKPAQEETVQDSLEFESEELVSPAARVFLPQFLTLAPGGCGGSLSCPVVSWPACTVLHLGHQVLSRTPEPSLALPATVPPGESVKHQGTLGHPESLI